MRDTHAEPGVLNGAEIVGIRNAGFPDVLSVVSGGPEALARVQKWLDSPPRGEIVKTAAVEFRAPLPRPPKIICIGLTPAPARPIAHPRS